MPNGYKITRSNYTLKKRHQTLSGGVVYERDFMTTTNLGGWDSGSIPYGENNFKMYYRAISNGKKNPYHGEWITAECSGETTNVFTTECLPEHVENTSEIRLKPNYNSLLDFAYYGSCTELVKSTVTKIIKTFPAEMYVVDGTEYGFAGDMILQNNLAINLTDKAVPDGENELRYFFKNYSQYTVVTEGKTGVVNNVTVLQEKDRCGDFVISVEIRVDDSYYTGNISGVTYPSGVKVVKTSFSEGTRFFPSSKHIDEFFENLDDFSKVLLNVNTNPIYSAVLDTPRETEKGVETYQTTYTWPTENGWNIVIEGEKFGKYIDGLLSISEFYDEYYTNNLWRMLTHDSIKAMDLAFSNPEKDEDQEDYNIGTTRLEGLFWAIGRQFDEIKRAIDNIKNTPKVSYDGNNNVPDYFITDALGLGGWEERNIDLELSRDEETECLFDGVLTGYNAKEANNIFLRNLKLNSRAIFAKKGTRHGIESLMNVFGLMSKDFWDLLPAGERPAYPDYEIHEYVSVVNNSFDAKTEADSFEELNELPVEEYNSYKLSYDDSELPEGEETDTTQGIPCRIKYVQENNGRIIKYAVPWFDKNKRYDGNLYYQARGGWGLHESEYNYGHVDVLGTYSGIGYDETIKYLVIVDKISDLRNIPKEKLYDGTLAFVNNLGYDADAGSIQITDESSNYFLLKHKEYYYVIDNEGQGWVNVSKDEAGNIVNKISYVQHIVESYLANNPHAGFGRYDLGREYLEYIKSPLKYSIDKDKEEQAFNERAYDCNGYLQYGGILFDLEENIDDTKCQYFAPMVNNGNANKIVKDGNEYFESETGYTPETKYGIYNFITEQSGNTADEITCDSVVNNKYFVITFNVKVAEKPDFERFLNSTLMPYLAQMIPSDVIFKYDTVLKAENEAVVIDMTPGVDIRDVDAIVSDSGSGAEDDVILDFPADRDFNTYIIDLSE